MTDEIISPRPNGIPVAEAFTLPAGRSHAALQNALSAVAKVHGDGVLPHIPVIENATMRKEAEYTHDGEGRAVQIAINPRAAQTGLSFLHEIGHFLEHKGIGLANFDLMERLQSVAGKSEAIRELRRLARRKTTLINLPNGLSMRYNIDKTYLTYLLLEAEIWARAYAQYVVVCSKDETLLLELEARRRQSMGQLYYPRQWDKSDFEPVVQEIDHLFARLEWRK